jgi:hypothetical protein
MEKTALDQSVSIHCGSNAGPHQITSGLEGDARWQLAQQIVDSPQFIRAPRLSQFLLYIVSKSVQGRAHEVTEQQIGVHVFGRPHGYRTSDDNIVRSYARQLRKRLSEYFASQGIESPLHIEIPLGGYLPLFTRSARRVPGADNSGRSRPVLVTVPDFISRPRRPWKPILVRTCLLLAYSVALIWLTAAWMSRAGTACEDPRNFFIHQRAKQLR